MRGRVDDADDHDHVDRDHEKVGGGGEHETGLTRAAQISANQRNEHDDPDQDGLRAQ